MSDHKRKAKVESFFGKIKEVRGLREDDNLNNPITNTLSLQDC